MTDDPASDTHKSRAIFRKTTPARPDPRVVVAVTMIVIAAASSAVRAAPTTDPFADAPDTSSGISILRPAAEPRTAPAPATPQIGNPLWSVPLSALTATQDRPVFLPSRRPPPRAVAAAPMPVAPLLPVTAPPPEPLQLFLIGAVVGGGDAIAVFVDRATQGIVRLRTGQTHAGWSLTSIQPREVTLTRGAQTETVVIQRGDVRQPYVYNPMQSGMPLPGINPALNDVPFVPRSTPKNGASDGL